MTTRCAWAGADPLYLAYHDEEWGVPVHDDRKLFEMLILEGAQAGLSWITILKKRDSFRRAYAGFEVDRVAAFTDADRARLMNDPGVIRNRLKVEAAIDLLVAPDHRRHAGALHERAELVAPEHEARVLALLLHGHVVGLDGVAPHHLEAQLRVVQAREVAIALERVRARDAAVHEHRAVA